MRDISISSFLGLNNILPPEALCPVSENFQTQYYLTEGKNIDITNELKILRRRGYDQVIAASAPHSMWADGELCLYREGALLRRLYPNLVTTSTLRSGISGSLSMAYLSFISNLVYYSDGQITGVIEGGSSRSWGIDVPSAPVVTATAGLLLFGTYRVTATYVRGDGQESGTSDIGTLEVASDGGLSVTLQASSDSSVVAINLYATKRDGDIFYRMMVLENEDQTVVYERDEQLSAIDCKTLFFSPPPAGQVLGYYNGRIYIGAFDCVWYTEPYRYELVNMMTDFIPFGEDVTLIAPVKDGIYFGTDREIIFARGEGPGKFQVEKLADYGAVFGTMSTIDVYERDGSSNKAAMFASHQGICLGKIGGDFVNVTEKTYRYDPADSGAGIVRFTRGIRQYVAVLRGSDIERSNNAYYEQQ